MTTYNLNSLTITADAWTPFNPTTGEGSNIDAVITNCQAENVIYANGRLSIRNDEETRIANEGDFACYNDDLASASVLTAVELDAAFVED
jgi:hypothetical protein